MASICPRNEQTDVATETEKIGMRSRSNGRIGYGSRSWPRMKKKPTTMSAATPSESTRGSSPWEKPSTEAIISPNVRAFITASRQSKRCSRTRTGFSGRNRRLSDRAISPIGMLTAKSHGQSATERMPAASVGPATDDTATTVALMPMPRPSRALG